VNGLKKSDVMRHFISPPFPELQQQMTQWA